MYAPTTGRFFVLESTDELGKKLQFEKLAARLAEQGYDVVTLEFPQFEQDSSYFVREYIGGQFGSTDALSPYTSSLFYALDHYGAKATIERALNEGKIVIANRFTGYSMALQGMKFRHPEERRGYFIWLDNLEFEMLRLPRPAFSIVLRAVPNINVQTPTEQGSQNPAAHTQATEAEVMRRQRMLAVYDDLSALFPKDFVRIDCARGAQSLNEQQIHELMWATISTHLPEAKNSKGSITSPSVTAADVNEQTKQLEAMSIQPENGRRYFTPPSLAPDLKQHYEAIIDRIYDIHGELTRHIVEYLKKQSAAPKAEQTSAWETAITDQAQGLAQRVVPIASNASAAFFAALQQISATAEAVKSDTKRSTSKLQKLADEMLPSTHMPATKSVDVTEATPRNELDLTVDMLFEQSNLSWREIQDAVSVWTYDEKERVLTAYLSEYTHSDGRHGNALKKARYTWDMVTEFSVFSDLYGLGASDSFMWQSLTPRYGYETPQLVIDAELTDRYDECFDLSLKLYGILLAAGHEQEAQFATLHGHKMRFQVSTHAVQAIDIHGYLVKQVDRYSGAQLAEELREKISEKHPILGASIFS